MNVVEIQRLGDQANGLGLSQTVFIEIASYPASKILGLAYVKDLSFCVFVEVNTRLGRKLRYLFALFHWHTFGSYNPIVTRRSLLVRLLSASVAVAALAGQDQERSTKQPGTRSSQVPQSKSEGNVPEEEDESEAPRKYTLDPLESDRNIRVGDFYWGKRDYHAALSRYEDATRYNPNSAEAFFKVGEAQEKLKHSDQAKLAFQKVIRIAPDTKLGQEAKKKLSRKG